MEVGGWAWGSGVVDLWMLSKGWVGKKGGVGGEGEGSKARGGVGSGGRCVCVCVVALRIAAESTS